MDRMVVDCLLRNADKRIRQGWATSEQEQHRIEEIQRNAKLILSIYGGK